MVTNQRTELLVRLAQVHTLLGLFCLVSWDPTLLHRQPASQLNSVDDNKRCPLSFVGPSKLKLTQKCKRKVLSLSLELSFTLTHGSKILTSLYPGLL